MFVFIASLDTFSNTIHCIGAVCIKCMGVLVLLFRNIFEFWFYFAGKTACILGRFQTKYFFIIKWTRLSPFWKYPLFSDCVFQNKLCFCVPMLVKDYWLSVMFATFERLLIVINVGGYLRLNSQWIFLPWVIVYFKISYVPVCLCWWKIIDCQ